MIGTSLLFSGSIAGLLGPGDIATPTAGYSLRPLSVSYSGAVVRVRRSGDNEEKDFNASGITDGQLSDFLNVFTESGHILNVYEHFKREFTESPLTFYNFEDVSLVCNCIEESSGLIAYDALQNMVSHQVAVYTDIDYPTIDDPSLVSPCNDGQADELNAFDDLLNLTTQNDGYVVTWYDQFGSNDATNSTAAEQPKIWDASTGLVTENGKPSLDFDGVDDGLTFDSSVFDIGNLSSFAVGKYDVLDATMLFAISGSTSNKRWYAPFASNIDFRFGYADSANALNLTGNTNRHIFTMISGSTLGNMEAWIDNFSLGTATLNSGIDAINGIGNLDGNFNADCNVQEILIYASDQSANRTKIEDNINDYYDIY